MSGPFEKSPFTPDGQPWPDGPTLLKVKGYLSHEDAGTHNAIGVAYCVRTGKADGTGEETEDGNEQIFVIVTEFVAVGSTLLACPVAPHAGSETADGFKYTWRQLPFGQVTLDVTSNAAGGGKYYGKSYGPSTATGQVSATGDLSAADIGTLAEEEDILFLNLEEKGQSTHVIRESMTESDVDPMATGQAVGFTTDSPPKLVVRGWSIASGCGTT